MMYNVIIFCKFKNTPHDNEDSPIHWKPEIPDFEDAVFVRDFIVLGEKANRKMCHMLVDERDDSVRDYIDSFNEGKPVVQQILNWWNKDVKQAYFDMWADIDLHPLIEDVAKDILKYPVDTLCDGEPCTLIVSVAEAEDTYGEVIDPLKIMIPHRFLGV